MNEAAQAALADFRSAADKLYRCNTAAADALTAMYSALAAAHNEGVSLDALSVETGLSGGFVQRGLRTAGKRDVASATPIFTRTAPGERRTHRGGRGRNRPAA